MFRTTFLTGEARVEDDGWHHVTAYIDDSASTIEDAVQFRTNPKGIDVEVDATTLWKTAAGARHRKMAVIRSDRRRSTARMSMFYASDADFSIKGKGPGRSEKTLAFIAHMLVVGGDKTWHGETRDDRERDAGILRAYIAAQES